MKESFKEEVIILTKELLSQIPFNTIYDYADVFFEKPKPLRWGDKEIQEQINFLKNTKLSEMEYESDNSSDFFLIRNRKTGQSAQFSNRLSTRGEFRASRFRLFLNTEKINNPSQSLYNAICQGIANPKYSNRIMFLKTAITGRSAEAFYDDAISKKHFDLYLSIIMYLLNKKVINKKITSSNVLTEIWEGIEIKKVLEQTLVWSRQEIADIVIITQRMVDQFSGPGYRHTEAKIAAENLHRTIVNALANYIQDGNKLDIAEAFGKVIDETSNVLGTHPHSLGVFPRIIQLLSEFVQTLKPEYVHCF